MANAFSGKRIRQDSAKLKALGKRERRLRKIGLSVLHFTQPMNWLQYFQTRKAMKESTEV